MRKNRETCEQYVARRLSEGWRIISRCGFNAILQSPEGMLIPVDLRNDVATFYPDAHPEATSVDGYVTHAEYSGADWATILAGAGVAASDSYIEIYLKLGSYNSTDKWRSLDRVILCFDTSSLPNDAIITSATLSVYGGAKTDILSVAPTVNIYPATPASAIELVAGDFDAVGPTPYCDTAKTYAGWSTSGYNDFTLNAAGLAAINKAGITKIALRIANYDAGGSTPTWYWEYSDSYSMSGFAIYSAEKGAGFKPTLTINYTVPVTAPIVTTQAASSVEATTATGNGTIVDAGGVNCTRQGFCYKIGTSGDPTTADSVAYDDGSFAAGAYTKGLTGLTPGTSYRVRAYAVNSAGTGYGATVQILTKPAAPTNVAATDGVHTDKVTITWTKSTGATGYQVYRDGVGLGWLGDVATYDDTGAEAPTITPGVAAASDGTSTAHVALSLSGQTANNGTTHTYKVRAKNATGESADSSTDTGYRGHGSLTYQWQRSSGDSDADYSNISGATSAAYNDTAAPAPTITPGAAAASDGTSTAHVALSLSGQSANVGAGRYYRCVENATGCAQQTSSANRGYRGVGSLTYQWQRSAADSDADYSDISGATTTSYNDTGAPADGGGRYYKCVENATGAAQQISTSNRGYRATYYSSGYIGDVIDCTALVDTYSRLEWTEELAGQDIEVKIRSSPDNASWSTWETIYSSPCTSFTTPVQRYLEWRATLSSNTMATPKLKDLTFNWTKKVE